jgi:hypothetical protein
LAHRAILRCRADLVAARAKRTLPLSHPPLRYGYAVIPKISDSRKLMIICGSRAEPYGQPWWCRKGMVGHMLTIEGGAWV